MAQVKYFGDMRTLTGKTEDMLIAGTLPALLNVIEKQYGKQAKKTAKSSLIVVDSEKVLSIRKITLSENSVVGFFPMCCGG